MAVVFQSHTHSQWLWNVQNETIVLSLPVDSKTHRTLMKACHCGWIHGMMGYTLISSNHLDNEVQRRLDERQ